MVVFTLREGQYSCTIDREEYIELDAQGKPEQAAAENVRDG